MIWALLAVPLALLTLPGTLELFVLTFGWLVPGRGISGPAAGPVRRLSAVIPAHDERENVQTTLRDLLACERPRIEGTETEVELLVVADNCTDETAELARAVASEAPDGFRITVVERQHATERGKGYALDHAFKLCLAREDDQRPDAFLIVDADTKAHDRLLSATTEAFTQGAEALQVPYHSGDPDASTRARLQHLALLCFNHLRPKSREALGASVGILGNGFGLRASLLKRVPYTAASIVEDLEYHINLVRAGSRVRFVPETQVSADAPPNAAGAETQRSRWEGGRFRMLADHAPGLAAEVLRGRLRLAEPLFELLLLPLAFHVLLLLPLLALPYALTQLYAAAALTLVGTHVLAGIFACGGTLKDLGALALAPFYVGWKLLMLPKILAAAARSAAWSRTERN